MKTHYIALLICTLFALGLMVDVTAVIQMRRSTPVDPPAVHDNLGTIDYSDSLMLRYKSFPVLPPNQREKEKMKHLMEHAVFQL